MSIYSTNSIRLIKGVKFLLEQDIRYGIRLTRTNET